MEIIIDPGLDWRNSYADFNKEQKEYTYIRIGTANRMRETNLVIVHEIAHYLIHCYWKKLNFSSYMLSPSYRIGQEILAWRLVKTFVKPKYWDIKQVKRALKGHLETHPIENLKLRKLKIIPLDIRRNK